MASKKPDWPFMVFRESLDGKPEALNDPNTPADERDRIRADINTFAGDRCRDRRRDTQQLRHAEDHQKRDQVMVDWVHGKPGERRRLAKRAMELTGEKDKAKAERRVKKWMEQLRKPSGPSPSETAPDDWRTVYHGEALRHYNSHPKKPKD